MVATDQAPPAADAQGLGAFHGPPKLEPGEVRATKSPPAPARPNQALITQPPARNQDQDLATTRSDPAFTLRILTALQPRPAPYWLLVRNGQPGRYQDWRRATMAICALRARGHAIRTLPGRATPGHPIPDTAYQLLRP